MSAESNKALARRWFEEVWNQGKESTIDELFPPQGKAHGWPEPDSVLHGPEGFKAIHRQFTGTFSDIHIEIDAIVAEENLIAVRWTCSMKHTGDGLGFPATGKHVVLPGASFLTCQDGKLMDGWNYMDLTKMTQQLQSVQSV
jgi:steroid delta-isomerase-like uncharacterized protein